MEYLSGEAIAGFFVILIVAVTALQRIGIIKIPTTRKQSNPGDSKAEVNSINKRVDRLTEVVVFKDTCVATHKGVDDKFDTIHAMMRETRDGVRDLLKK